jgi:hypothetical protein
LPKKSAAHTLFAEKIHSRKAFAEMKINPLFSQFSFKRRTTKKQVMP